MLFIPQLPIVASTANAQLAGIITVKVLNVILCCQALVKSYGTQTFVIRLEVLF